jgi:hypothetical protein
MITKLTDTQLIMLSAAAQREHSCLTVPEKLKGAAIGKVAAKLMALGLAREIKAKTGVPVWRRDKAGEPFALKLTAAGSKAINVEDEPGSAPEFNDAPMSAGGVSQTEGSTATADRSQHGGEAAPRDGSKLALVIGLLRQGDGATLVNLTEATGWLPHTTRAAITGLRKRGYSVIRERSEAGGSVYRITDVAADRVASNPHLTKTTTESRCRSKAKRAA